MASEVVGLVVGDLGVSNGDCDLLVEDHGGNLRRVQENR